LRPASWMIMCVCEVIHMDTIKTSRTYITITRHLQLKIHGSITGYVEMEIVKKIKELLFTHF
jgi:hypothetical protein